MAVTINDIPKLSFTQNEVKVVITSDNYLQNEGAKGVYKLDFDNTVSPNIGLGHIYFVLRNNRILYGYGGMIPGNPPLYLRGYDLPMAVVDETKAQYAVRLRDALDAGFEINQDFVVSVDNESILLTARNFGTDYALQVDTSSDAFVFTEETEAMDRTIKEGFKHHIQLWNGDLTTKIYETNVPLDYPENGATTMDISTILHSLVSINVPNLTDVFQRCPDSVFPYVIKYAQRYGDSQVIKELKRTGILNAVYGGYSMMALAHIKSATHLQDYLLKAPNLYEIQNWYESYPLDNIEVRTNQPQFLYFINSRTISEVIRIRVVATFLDGTTQIVIRDAGEIGSLEKVCLNVSYKGLGLDGVSTELKKVVSYQVNLIGPDNEPRTVSKNFIIQRDYEANTRYFLFSGSDGNYKTLRTYGVADATSEFAPVTGQSLALQSEKILKGEALTFDVLGHDNEEVNSGYIIGSQKQNAIKELMFSTSVFRVFGSKLIPVQLMSKEIQLAKERTGTSTVKLGYRIAWDDRLYTGDTWALNVPQINQSQESLNDI